jgi:DNA-binding CsgD family transcriptional regulator/tetratricopeptide (TPR) repeat protein
VTPLLERDEDLAVLLGTVEAARTGRGVLVLVAGEAGIGKTSLLRELRATIDADARFFVGACEPLSVPAPLQPLRELAAASGAPELADLAGDDRLALARALLDVLCAHAPTVAVVEDAHWADPGTLDVVRLLARRVEDAPVVFIVTYRDDEVAANEALALLVGDLVTAPTVRRIALRVLSADAVRTLAAPAGLDAAELSRVTGGNPLLVVESIAAGGRLPSSVRDATLARVGRLSPAARGVVDAAAVIGQRVPPAVLAVVAPDSEAAVEEALARGVLTDDGAILGFRHELIREAIESSIAAPRRAQLHGLVVSALTATGEPADHARLAHHAERAGLVDEAVRHAALAASAAEAVGALSEASRQLDRALRLGGRLEPRDRLELLLRFTRATNFAGRVDESLEAAEQAVETATALGDPRGRGRALSALAAACWSVDRLDEAKAAAAEAVAVLADVGDAGELARAHAALLRMEALAFDPAAAIAAAPHALGLATAAGAEDVRVDILISLAAAHGHRGEHVAEELIDEALALGLARRLHVQCIRAYVNAAGIAVNARDHARLDAIAPDAHAMFEAYQVAPPLFVLVVEQSWSLLDRGRYEEALTRAAAAGASRLGFRPVRLALEGTVAARRGDADAAGLLDEAQSQLAPVAPGRRHTVVLAALAEAAWLRGDHSHGRAHARAGLAVLHAAQFSRPAGDLALWAMRCGDHVVPSPLAPEPALRELSGDWRGAIRGWQELDAPYEAALAALPGDERAAQEAVAALQRLGATAAARAFARERAARGASAPRGPRRTTLVDAAGLTRREREVLEHVALGATNAGIADALHLSERTVAHHVSAVLQKLGAPTRTAAVNEARRRGVLPQDGPAAGPT